VITENVPADALALARGRQVNKLGWAKARRRELAAGKKTQKPPKRRSSSSPSRRKSAGRAKSRGRRR
jgi:hypothetical protein